MIVPSIDLSGGRAVQLVEGEAMALEAGDPRPLLERFSVVGEVAVIDIDAARGEGSNQTLVEEMCRMAPIRVGGGIRDRQTALRWLDRGAEKVIIGTAATPHLISTLPRDRVIVALDTRGGEVLSHGWRKSTGTHLTAGIEAMRDLCSGFLVTFVEREGHMGGTDMELASEVVSLAGEARVTVAGGVTTTEEIARLDRLGADAQVGMALYTGRLDLATAFAAPLVSDRSDSLWPTVVVDEAVLALGSAFSSEDSLRTALETRRGVYQSRARGIWVKGETSGAVQHLIRVDADCDRDTLRFTVAQHDGFCHTGTRTCWGPDRGLHRLERRIANLDRAGDPESNTLRLLGDPTLLTAKIEEEAAELSAAGSGEEVVREAADLLYFTLVKARAAGVTLSEIEAELDRRERKVTRRPMVAKEGS